MSDSKPEQLMVVDSTWGRYEGVTRVSFHGNSATLTIPNKGTGPGGEGMFTDVPVASIRQIFAQEEK